MKYMNHNIIYFSIVLNREETYPLNNYVPSGLVMKKNCPGSNESAYNE